jgi:hypothetical protein
MGPRYDIGLDVHKQKISYCVKDVGGRIHAEGRMPATRFDDFSEYDVSGGKLVKVVEQIKDGTTTEFARFGLSFLRVKRDFI